MENQVKAITIKKEEFEWKVGEAVATSMNRMDRCMRTSKAAEDRDVMGILAVTVFHMKGISEAMEAMEKEIFKNSSLVHITEPGYDKLSMDLVQRKAKKLLETKEDGEREPMPIVVAETMAWNLAFQELRRVLFDEKANKEDEIFHSARENILRETEKPLKDYEMNAMKFKMDGPVYPQTAWANTEASQADAASAPEPEQTGTENLERAQTDEAIEKIKECDFGTNVKEAERASQDPGFQSAVKDLEKRRPFLEFIRRRFGF